MNKVGHFFYFYFLWTAHSFCRFFYYGWSYKFFGGFYILEKLALSLRCCSIYIIRDSALEKEYMIRSQSVRVCFPAVLCVYGVTLRESHFIPLSHACECNTHLECGSCEEKVGLVAVSKTQLLTQFSHLGPWAWLWVCFLTLAGCSSSWSFPFVQFLSRAIAAGKTELKLLLSN